MTLTFKNSTLEHILDDVEKCQDFLYFLEQEYCNENLIFWIDAEEYKKLTGVQELNKTSRHIYNKYIHQEAEYSVNIPANIMQQILKDLSFPHNNIFVSAQDHVFDLLKLDLYPRFMMKMQYLESGPALPPKDFGNFNHIDNLPDIDRGNILKGFKRIALGDEKYPGWTPSPGGKQPNNALSSFRLKWPGSDFYSLKTTCTIRASPWVVYRFLMDLNEIKSYDPLFSDGHVITRHRFTTDLIYHAYNSKSHSRLMKNLDYVLLRIGRQEEDGVNLITYRSVVNPKTSSRKHFMRSSMETSGFLIAPYFHKNTGQTRSTFCKVTFLLQLRREKKIPEKTWRSYMDDRMLILSNLRDCIENQTNLRIFPTKQDKSNFSKRSSRILIDRRRLLCEINLSAGRLRSASQKLEEKNIIANETEIPLFNSWVTAYPSKKSPLPKEKAFFRS